MVEVDEEQLSLFGESVLQLHDKIFQMLELMNQQVDETTKLAKVVQNLSDEVQYLKNEKYNAESKFYQLQQRIDNLENDVYLKTSYGSRSHEKVSDVVSKMKEHFDRFNDGRLATTFVALMEIFRIHLTQISDSDRAEILSVLSAQQGYVENAYQLGLQYNPSELLRLVAKVLDQPESIITLYR